MARSEAQKAADKRYREKNHGRERTLMFKLKKEEADYFDHIIRQAGMTKADFLRMSIKNYLEKNKKV